MSPERSHAPGPPDPSDASASAAAAVPGARGGSYDQIVRSSVLIGGSSAINIVVGVVRTKLLALLLGPAGFGLLGLYTSIANLVQSVAGMGVNSSGVRQIAAAAGSGDRGHVAATAFVLRRSSVLLGTLGALALAALSRPVAQLTFGSAEQTLPVALLSLAVLFKTVSDGQGALVQGLRRISDLARITVVGGLLGAAASVAVVYVLRERGVVPSLIAVAAMTLFVSWRVSRGVALGTFDASASAFRAELASLLRLGFAFMASAMLMMGAAYVVRMIVARHAGLAAAGLYQSAWAIGGMYVGFVLQAMGADFYPRLTAATGDPAECNRLVNEQAEVSLLLAGPGVLATLTLSPLVIYLLYSQAFGNAVEVLRWICLGALFQVITWPMGFIIVAGGRQAIFFWTEVAYAAVHVAAAQLLVRALGVEGAGVAFFVSYAFHGLMIYPVVRWLTGFRWTARNRRLGAGFLVLTVSVFAGFRVLPFWLATAGGLLAAAGSGLYSLRALARLVSVDRLPGPARRVLGWMRLTP